MRTRTRIRIPYITIWSIHCENPCHRLPSLVFILVWTSRSSGNLERIPEEKNGQMECGEEKGDVDNHNDEDGKD